MEQKEAILQNIKTIVHSFLKDSKVLLFGSRAKNTSDVDSDYDILIITPIEISIKEKLSLKTNIRKALLEQGIRSDILIQTEKDVEAKKDIAGHIIKSIMKNCVVL